MQLFILNASASVTLIINYLGKKYALSVNCFNFNRLKPIQVVDIHIIFS